MTTSPSVSERRPVKILFSCDDFSHSRGYYVLATALRDAGIEAVLGGPQEPAQMAATAVQEDVDVIGYRIMSGESTILISRLLEQLKSRDAEDIPIIVGGVIPPLQVAELKVKGVKEVFLPGARLDAIIQTFNRYRRTDSPGA